MKNPILSLLVLLALAACKPAEHGHAHGPGDAHHEEEVARGPNGGRLLSEDGFAVELAIFEDGVPPEYRAWITRDGQPLAPEDVKLSVQLARLDGEIHRYAFTPQGAFLRGEGIVAEPHSFAVTVSAAHEGKVYGWQYDSFEGRVTIPEASAKAAGIAVEAAGPQRIREVLPLYGRIALKPEAQREVRARFPGRIVSVARNVGDTVKSGEVLARVESDDSLQVYAITAPIAGTVTARGAQPGEQAGGNALFAISDLSQIRAELSAFPRDLAALATGQEVRLRTAEGAQATRGRIERIAPVAGHSGGAVTVWASVDAAWTPGLFVNAEVTTGGADVPLAVKTSALQAFRDFTVAFAKVGEIYEVRVLELGRRDGEHVEVLGGLKPGTEVVIGNSYLIKADIEKSGASHDH
jgi:membrane fusion protein, heavy metal efflux system